MNRIFTGLKLWVAVLLAPSASPDPLDGLSAREWADLPVHHPRREEVARR